MITELLNAVVSWNAWILVFALGFVPGSCLRLIVKMYPVGDPRRDELIAELYSVPPLRRPFWVAEQLEVALFEGVANRRAVAIIRRHMRRRSSYAASWILVRDAVNQLPDIDRVVFTLYYLEGLDFSKLGKVLSMTEVEARRQHLRTVRQIRNEIRSRVQ